MTGIRDLNRQENTARILAAARRQIAEEGGGALSMRAVAREIGMVSSAVFRYFPTREALLTAMILESYGHLADALTAADASHTPAESNPPDSPDGVRWRTLAEAFRAWALAHPHEFHLIYGTPVPGYAAPPETIPAAEAVARPFLAIAARNPARAYAHHDLHQALAPAASELGLAPSRLAAVLAELAALVGFLHLELGGHFVGTADPADGLYDALVTRQVATLFD